MISGSKYRTVVLNVNGVVRTVFVPADEDNAEEIDPFAPDLIKKTPRVTTNAVSQSSKNAQQGLHVPIQPRSTVSNVAKTVPNTTGNQPAMIGQPKTGVGTGVQPANFQVFNVQPVRTQTPVAAVATPANQATQATNPVITTPGTAASKTPLVPQGSTFLLGTTSTNLGTVGLQQPNTLLTPVQPLYMQPQSLPRQSVPTVGSSQIMLFPQAQVQQPQVLQGTASVNLFQRPTATFQNVQTLQQVTTPQNILFPNPALGLLRSNTTTLVTTPLIQPSPTGVQEKASQPEKEPIVLTSASTTHPSSVVSSVLTTQSSRSVAEPIVIQSTSVRTMGPTFQPIAPKPPPSTTTVIHVKEVSAPKSTLAAEPGSGSNPAVEAGVKTLLSALKTQDSQQCAQVLESLQQSLKSKTQQLDKSSEGSKPVQAVGPFRDESDHLKIQPNTASDSAWQEKFAADYTRRTKVRKEQGEDSPEPLPRRQTRGSRKRQRSVSSEKPKKFFPDQKTLKSALAKKHKEDMKRYCSKELLPFVQICTVKLSKLDVHGKKKVKYSDLLTNLYPDIFEK